jgi:PAT family beta-lactamase induction signal transducer AmpG
VTAPVASPPDPPPARRAGTIAWTGSTYFAEGLPWSILHQVAAEFFTAAGLPARQVGFTSALHLTSSLKFLWSPIVDLFGTLRQWMIATQLGLGLLFGVLAVLANDLFFSPGERDTTVIWLVLVAIGIASATHDIACDGYYMAALGREDQARYTGIRVAAFRAAMLVGSSGLVYLGGAFHWLAGFGVAALLMGVLAIAHRLRLPHVEARRDGAAKMTDEERWDHVRRSYLSFLTQERAAAVILLLLTFKLGDALMFGMSKVLLRELGVTTAERGILNGFGIGTSILGAVLGGMWIARTSLARALLPIALLMAATEPLYLYLAAPSLPGSVLEYFEAPASLAYSLSPPLWHIGAIMIVEQLFGGMATAAQTIFIMRRCHPDHRAAHFAFATAIYALAQMLSGTYSGILYETHGPIVYFCVTSVACIPCLILIPLLRLK